VQTSEASPAGSRASHRALQKPEHARAYVMVEVCNLESAALLCDVESSALARAGEK